MIKKIIDKLGRESPDFIGRLLSQIPFNIRIGKDVYDKYKLLIKKSEEWTEDELEEYVITHFKNIFEHAKKFKMYEEKYKKVGVYDLEIKTLKDITQVPILSKSEIRKAIEQFDGFYTQNTGGTSGNPLPLYLDKDVWKREWAHYHIVWSKTGFNPTDAKFFFRGVNINNNFIKYDFQHNIYIVNIYKDPSLHLDEFFKTLLENKIKYFQGYPSAINDFLKKIEEKISPEQKEIIKNQIEYCFFSSEYPTPQIIDYIKNVWNIDFISCYGHSEVCVLAASKINELTYYPYHTYGYVEVENNRLIGTSYHNYDMPLVRYDTGDLVESDEFKNSIIKSFEIREGRVGDFILDKNNMQISLTGMFFGRHHKIFNYINHIQIYQEQKGKATILITHTREELLDAKKMMNLKGIAIDFDFLQMNEPVRTQSGKVVLKVLEMPNKHNIKNK